MSNVNYALTDYTKDDGALAMVPGKEREAVLERHRGDLRLAKLVGLDTHYGWTEERPDWVKNARNRRAGINWHA